MVKQPTSKLSPTCDTGLPIHYILPIYTYIAYNFYSTRIVGTPLEVIMAVQDRSVLVLYGSETGNAQDMAEELGRVCQRLHFNSRVEELDAVDLVS